MRQVAMNAEMLPFRTVLCPVDFDVNSFSALRLAAEIAAVNRGVLHLLHVVELPQGPEVAVPFEKIENAAKAKLERVASRKAVRNVRHKLHVRSGSPGAEILLVARQVRADVIVMATHGRRGIRRFVLGSVAESVIRETPCPVLVLKPAGRVARSVVVRKASGRRVSKSRS